VILSLQALASDGPYARAKGDPAYLAGRAQPVAVHSMLFLCWPTKDTKHVVHSFMTCHVVFVSSSTLVTLHC
jgi:hypothetical protein